VRLSYASKKSNIGLCDLRGSGDKLRLTDMMASKQA
jgi:hypothetical protein